MDLHPVVPSTKTLPCQLEEEEAPSDWKDLLVCRMCTFPLRVVFFPQDLWQEKRMCRGL